MADEKILALATFERKDKEDEQDGIKLFDDPVVKPSSMRLKCTEYLELVSFSRSWKRYARAFAKIRITACA